MAHQHSVYDTDKHFLIDPITREIINQTPDKIQLMQGDHNSERFTFEIAKVDGHDMSKCDKIEVHFLNVAADKTGQNSDVYPVEDIQISPIDSNVIIFSWLVSNNATQFAGTLNFVIRFICLTGETIDYVWNTGIFKGISVGEGMNNSEGVIADYSDVLEAWRQDLFEAGGESVANVNMARDEALNAIQEEKAAQIEAIETKGAEVLAAIPEEYGALNENVEANSANIEEMQKIGDKHSSLISRHDKRIKTLEGAVYGDLAKVKEDNTVAYIKNVPSSALGTAKIRAIGGMTRKCANLFDVSKAQIGYRCNADGSIVQNSSYATSDYIEVKGGTSYYLTNVCGNNYCSAVLFDANKAYVNITSFGEGGKVSGVLNVDSNIKYIRINIFTAVVDINTVMVNAGSTALPYEPYFEGLRSAPVEEVESVGVNLFDINNRRLGTIDENGDLKCEERTGTFYTYPFKENTRYTLSGYVKNHNTTGNVRFRVVYTDGTSENNVLLNSSTEWVYRTYTTEAGKTVDRITLWHGDVGYMYIKGGELMINEGTTALPYTPFVKHTLPIPEAVRPKNGINADVYDSIEWGEDETRKSHKRVGIVVIDGDEDIVYSDGKFIVIDIFPKTAKVEHGICDGYEYNGVWWIALANNQITTYITGRKGVAIRDDNYTTESEFKAKLAAKPITLVYELATPEVTDISDILPADNYIEVEGGGTLTFKNEYEYDVPSEVTFVTKEVSA